MLTIEWNPLFTASVILIPSKNLDIYVNLINSLNLKQFLVELVKLPTNRKSMF